MQLPHPVRWMHDRFHREMGKDGFVFGGLPKDSREAARIVVERMRERLAKVAERENLVQSHVWQEIEKQVSETIIDLHRKAESAAVAGNRAQEHDCLIRAHTLNQLFLGLVNREVAYEEYFKRNIKTHELFGGLYAESIG